MAEKIPIKAVEMVRRIRDEQARLLTGKSKAEIIAFFKMAGDAARQRARQAHPAQRANPAAPGDECPQCC